MRSLIPFIIKILGAGSGIPGTQSSIQRGTITIAPGATTGTATISAVSSKASCHYCGVKSTGSGFVATDTNATVYLTNTTTVTVDKGTSSATATTYVSYEVRDRY